MEEEKPGAFWGLKHTATAGVVMSLVQFYALQEFIFTRKEAEAEIKRIDFLEAEHSEIKKELYQELKSLNLQVAVVKTKLEQYLEIRKLEKEEMEEKIRKEQEDLYGLDR